MGIKLIIAGGRDFDDYDMLCRAVDHITKNFTVDEVVCGLARGADALGMRYAEERRITTIFMPALWKEKGKAAGMIRNVQMAAYADALIAFWDGESRGTKHMIEVAQKKGLMVRVVRY